MMWLICNKLDFGEHQCTLPDSSMFSCMQYGPLNVSVTCMLFIFLFIIDILFTYFLSDLDIDSKQVVYICFKILLEE